MIRKLLVLILGIFLAGTVAQRAQAESDLRRVAILTAATEALVGTISLADDRRSSAVVQTALKDFTWHLTFSESDWRLDGKGAFDDQAFIFTMIGYLWGNEGETFTISYSGLGRLGDEPLRINGESVWLYNQDAKDYRSMDFRHVVKFGEHSVWGWIAGGEIIGGGIIGAGSAIVATTVATGGIALGAAWWIGAGGAVGGASALVSISETVKTLVESDTPVPAPEIPSRPSAPSDKEPLTAKDGIIVTAVTGTGMRATSPDGKYMLVGESGWEKGYATGRVDLLQQ